ncbi:hypothetical protein BGZ93_008540 [Podila epicladia]|nr:hypothetical protein BGZ93_008540 [Podila epicladia]
MDLVVGMIYYRDKITFLSVPVNIKFFADWIKQQKRLRCRQGQQKEEAIQKEKLTPRVDSEDVEDLSDLRNM